LALPIRILPTHALRKELFLEAGRRIAELAKRHISSMITLASLQHATKAAFNNAISPDITMGNFTIVVSHLLTAATEAGLISKWAYQLVKPACTLSV
jgi:dihydroxy-acid dehydratase